MLFSTDPRIVRNEKDKVPHRVPYEKKCIYSCNFWVHSFSVFCVFQLSCIAAILLFLIFVSFDYSI